MRIVKRLPPATQQEMAAYIRQYLLPLANREHARCVRGRLNLWLQAEPDYATSKYKPACNDQRLWNFCQKVYPEASLAQVYFAKGNIGIGWHRDASFCKSKAFIVNLGKVRLETQIRNDLTVLDLEGGEIVEFNAKQLHRSIPRSEDRIGFAIWAAAIDMKDLNNWMQMAA